MQLLRVFLVSLVNQPLFLCDLDCSCRWSDSVQRSDSTATSSAFVSKCVALCECLPMRICPHFHFPICECEVHPDQDRLFTTQCPKQRAGPLIRQPLLDGRECVRATLQHKQVHKWRPAIHHTLRTMTDAWATRSIKHVRNGSGLLVEQVLRNAVAGLESRVEGRLLVFRQAQGPQPAPPNAVSRDLIKRLLDQLHGA